MEPNSNNDEMQKLIELVHKLNQNQNVQPTSDSNLEQLLINTILNPVWMKTKKKILIDCQGNNEVIAGTREGSIPHSSGFTEEVNDEYIPMLDDGTSTCGIVICQSCGGGKAGRKVKRQNGG